MSAVGACLVTVAARSPPASGAHVGQQRLPRHQASARAGGAGCRGADGASEGVDGDAVRACRRTPWG